MKIFRNFPEAPSVGCKPVCASRDKHWTKPANAISDDPAAALSAGFDNPRIGEDFLRRG
jgi:hypothetical protein